MNNILMYLNNAYAIIDSNNIHLINLIFIGFIAIIVVFGSLMTLVEQYLPACIKQSFRYGKHSLKGQADKLVSRLEVPKGWFAHFYVFALCWSVLALYLMLKSIVMQQPTAEYVMVFLDFVAGGASNRKAQINSTFGLVATILMTLQCARRFYETNFVQIFSKKSKINLSHYLVGYIHYFGAIIALLANTEGFVRDTAPTPFTLNKVTILQYICIFFFHFSWTQQYKSNMILVNLRKDNKTGKVATEAHLMPRGGFFDVVSSPHMLFEVLMYTVLLGLLWPSTTWRLVVLWVFGNQVLNALLSHQWYKETFKNYPKNRRALLPFLL